MDPCLNWNFLFDHPSAGGAFGLVSDKEYVVFRVIQTLSQVIDYSSSGAHAAAGNDDGGAVDIQQFLMILVFVHRIEPGKIKGVVALCLEVFGLLIPEGLQA